MQDSGQQVYENCFSWKILLALRKNDPSVNIDFNKPEGYSFGMIKHQVCVDANGGRRGIFWEEKHHFSWKWWQSKNKQEKLPFPWALLSSISTMSQLESWEFELADRHKGYKWENTSPKEPFHAALRWGAVYLCFGIIITMWERGKIFSDYLY